MTNDDPSSFVEGRMMSDFNPVPSSSQTSAGPSTLAPPDAADVSETEDRLRRAVILALVALPIGLTSATAVGLAGTSGGTLDMAGRLVVLLLALAAVGGLGVTALGALEKARRARRDLHTATETVERLVLADSLTGLMTRRGFDGVMADEWRRCAGTGRPMSVLIADIDAFVAYLDALGRHAADIALCRVATAVAECAPRPGDAAARFGADSLALTLPGLDLEDARAVAAAIHDRLRLVAVPHPASPVAPRLTVSIGVACGRPAEGGSAALLVDEADEARHEAKHRGRNGTALHWVQARAVAR